MAMVLTGGHDTYSALMYGMPDPNVTNFIQQYNQYAPQTLLPAAHQFFDQMKQNYRSFDENLTLRSSKAAIRKMANLWQIDGIVPLETMERMQQASPTMQRWIMACPEIRQEYHAQRCDGYSGSYIDYEPFATRESHYDYRCATNGIYLPDKNQNLVATTWIEELYPGDSVLSFHDQMDIEQTWHYARMLLARRGDDPTSKENNSL